MNPAGRLLLLVQLPIPPPGPEPIRGNVPLAAGLFEAFRPPPGPGRPLPHRDCCRRRLANILGDQGLVEAILARQPWMVGFTCYLWNIERRSGSFSRLKQRQPDLRVLLGGPEITADNAWVSATGRRSTTPFSAKASRPLPNCSTPCEQGRSRSAAIAGLWTAAGRQLPALRRLRWPAWTQSRRRTWKAFSMRPTEHDAPGNQSAAACSAAATATILRVMTARCDLLSPRETRRQPAPCRPSGDVDEVVLLDPTLNQRRDFLDFLRGSGRGNPERRLHLLGRVAGRGDRCRRGPAPAAGELQRSGDRPAIARSAGPGVDGPQDEPAGPGARRPGHARRRASKSAWT